MDCQLPQLDGYEATRRIRTHERHGEVAARTPSLPIVALTASATKEDVDRCFAAGMSDYVSKPVDARLLLSTIASRLEGDARPAASGSKPRPSSVPVANIPQALERLAGDRGLFTRMAALFVDGASTVRTKLRSAVEAQDARDVGFAAHRLRGQAATFGGDRLVERAAELDDAAKSGNWSAAGAVLLGLEKELDRLLRALASVEETRPD
jgi:CheY-like chemotaxis protein